ncbi:unnamed protein product [Plutella xylostella]|uniref:DAZ-associated protein 2 n=2 Tax=Plutella xylostella TaxID=51655 RepID=A0A8S4G1A8_PLUXY|nr:DAZ-associated protein 2 isoform X1 [Plutella xylostella]CAG9133621.1 unnamed protein product [Plutella xylostella]
MADKKVTPPLGAYPQPQPPQGPFLPAPPQHAAPQYSGEYYKMGGGSPYGVTFGGAGAGGGMYAPPPYDQLQHHQTIPALSQQLPQLSQQMYSPAAAMYAAATYPGYIGYPVQYYPYYPTVQPSIQPLRPTIMIPNGFEGGARFDGISQPLLPPAPAAVPPSPAQLAAMATHQVLWR